MKRIIYLSLLLVIPFLVTADHVRDRINGKWISPFHGKVIKVKVKRHEVRIKNLTRNGWSTFRPTRRGKFIDRHGNSIRIKNVHELTYRSNCGDQRIRFVKKGHVHHNHVCNSACGINREYFTYQNGDNIYNHEYGNYSSNDSYDDYENNDYGRNSGYTNNQEDRWSNRNDNRSNSQRLQGRYFVREINEYVIIEDTRYGIRAKRGNREWVNYRQNRNRKNEYLDSKGNRYNVRSDKSLYWKNKSGSISLNLTK